MAETTVAKVYAALPGSVDSIEVSTGLTRKMIIKTLSNMTHRKQIKMTGKRGPDRKWSVRKGGGTPLHVRHVKVTKAIAAKAVAKAKTGKGVYKRRKKKKPAALLLQLDIINTRLKIIEDVLGI